VQTLRAAGDRLASAATLADLAALAAALGFDSTPARFDDDTRRALGLRADVADAAIVCGSGALRALLLEVHARAPLRETLGEIARRLRARTPHVLWLLLATQRGGSQVALAAWPNDRATPRLAALLADRGRILESDAESVRALAAVDTGSDLLAHARWVEILGREALTRRFYRTLEKQVAALAASSSIGSAEDRATIALLYTSRLLFLAFLQAKGWLDGDHDFLVRRFDGCMATGGGFHRRVLLPLFFGTLNTPPRRRADAARGFGRVPFLNGGLFSRSAVERGRTAVFSDESLGAIVCELLARYRFTSREESAEWSEAAIDPEMLGRAFESLMASGARRDSGAFYTPFALVERATARALSHWLERRLGAHLARRFAEGEELAEHERASVRNLLGGARVLDPACGSGAFLVHALERLADLTRRAGDDRPLAELRREVLTRSIFGVDVNPTAVWLCELRLWLSVVIESDETDPLAVAPLPNLDRNVRVGDSLAGRAFVPDDSLITGSAALARVRARYARATGARKERLARVVDREELRRALGVVDIELRAVTAARAELALLFRGRDLFGERRRPNAEERSRVAELKRRARELRSERRRIELDGALPFSFAIHFADVAAAGGFDLVLGNPPWVRPHRVPEAQRRALRRAFVVMRDAAWSEGAALAHAGPGFGAQTDIAALFVERSVRLLAPGGTLALLLPVKLWRSLAGGGVRSFLERETHLVALEDHSESASAFDAVVYPSVLVAERATFGPEHASHSPMVEVATFRREGGIGWRLPQRRLAFDDSAGAPWILLPREVRAAFDAMRERGVALASSVFGRPLLGVKCGCNAAFIVRCTDMRGSVAQVLGADGRRGELPVDALRPLLRGEHLRGWRRAPSEELLVWTHRDDGLPRERLPAPLAHWLAPWRRDLLRRTDARERTRWWSLFRIDGARCDRPRVVWRDVGRFPAATVIESGDPVVPLNSCYVARCPDEYDALALAAVLQSPLARAWLAVVAEPARGGYHRYLGWTMALLPLPRDWDCARMTLAPMAERAMHGEAPSGDDLVAAALEAYGLKRRVVAPLLAWLGEQL
jgi:hypothetical protein